MFRPRFLCARLPRFTQTQITRRSIHHVPEIAGGQFTNGVDNLLSEEGYDIAWTKYQALMLDKLNALTNENPEDNSMTPLALLGKYARIPTMAALFNHASMAHNNYFFFKNLSQSETQIPELLKESLVRDFGSIDTLRQEFIAIGNSMFGPGYVWLVKTSTNEYKLLNTYIAGSPYPQAHFRRQSTDMNTEAQVGDRSSDHFRRQSLLNSEPVNAVGVHGSLSASAKKLAPGGISLTPILCVSTWQHVWLPDWGIGGKKEFLEAWWNRINWNEVADVAASESRLMR